MRGFNLRTRVPDASSRGNGGPRLERGGPAGTPLLSPNRGLTSKGGPGDPRRRYPPRRRAGLTVSGSDGRPFGQATGPRLKRASGSLQWNSAFEAEPERRSGSRTRDRMLKRHLLYPSELPSLEDRPVSSRPTTIFVQRNTGYAERTAPAGTTRARARGRAKGRAYDSSRNRMQDYILVSPWIPAFQARLVSHRPQGARSCRASRQGEPDRAGVPTQSPLCREAEEG